MTTLLWGKLSEVLKGKKMLSQVGESAAKPRGNTKKQLRF